MACPIAFQLLSCYNLTRLDILNIDRLRSIHEFFRFENTKKLRKYKDKKMSMRNETTKKGFIEVERFKLRYSQEGKGIPALVIGSALYYPRTFSQALRKHFQLIFVDHRGFAKSDKPVDISNLTLDTFLDDIEKIRSELGLGRIMIIGHSGHGYMALEYAKKYPEHVSHVALLAMGPDQSDSSRQTADHYFDDSVCPERKAMLAKDLQHLAEELRLHPEKSFITFCIRLGARSWYDYTFDASPLWKDVTVTMPIIDYAWGKIFRDIDITQGLENFDKPVFLALGKFDYLVAPFFSWNLIRSKFKNLTLRLFEKSGHTPQYEEPELFDEELLQWFLRHKEK